MSEAAFTHVPVLLDEVIEHLITDSTGTYIDATFGRGGHTHALLERLRPCANLLVIDRDPEALMVAEELASSDRRVSVQLGNFSEINMLPQVRESAPVHGILFDVGVSTPQIRRAKRGFSFDEEGPLDMRMDPSSGESASSWLNRSDPETIANVLREYGGVEQAYKVASAIHARIPLSTTTELSAIVKRQVLPRASPVRLLAQVFQAIRIKVNDELRALDEGLRRGIQLLAMRGRLAVITFHSLEHRIARQFVADVTMPTTPRRMPLRRADEPIASVVKRNLRPTKSELHLNPSARSAMLQVVERIR